MNVCRMNICTRRVLQSCPIESIDTPANRFVRHSTQSIQTEAESLLSHTWRQKLPTNGQAVVTRFGVMLHQVLVRASLRKRDGTSNFEAGRRQVRRSGSGCCDEMRPAPPFFLER